MQRTTLAIARPTTFPARGTTSGVKFDGSRLVTKHSLPTNLGLTAVLRPLISSFADHLIGLEWTLKLLPLYAPLAVKAKKTSERQTISRTT